MKTVFPEDLKALSIEDLETLRVAGLAEFDGIHTETNAFASVSPEQFADIESLTAGLELVKAEQLARKNFADTLAAAKATRDEFTTITINSGTLDADLGDGGDDASATDDGSGDAPIVAAADRDAQAQLQLEQEAEVVPEIAYATGEGLGVAVDTPLTWSGIGEALDKRFERFNVSPYRQAAQSGTVLKTTQNFAAFKNVIPEDRMVRENNNGHSAVRAAIDAARATRKLKGAGEGSLIASGGWGAPSPIDYTPFRKLSSQDGLATFPTIGVEHGGLQITQGVNFADVFASNDFIAFSEQNDIDGDYGVTDSGAHVDGTKPIYRIGQATWVDYRLQVDGVHIQSGILNQRGYPEGIANEVAEVLDAHAHKINAKVIAKALAGSTAIGMTAGQVGSVAPTLTAVELQVLHYRDTHRMSFTDTLEAKFPFWLKGAFRADLSRRLGVDLLDVPDARIMGWFSDRGVSVEWVYDWQSIASTPAGNFTAFPSSVAFLLYAAGTWVKGVSDIISLDTMYDSTLLGTNDYTIMFTEEGWFLAKAGHDSRVVTVPISSTGATNIGVEIANSGAEAA